MIYKRLKNAYVTEKLSFQGIINEIPLFIENMTNFDFCQGHNELFKSAL